MKHVTLASALATIAIAVPAGWHALDADIQSDGPQMRPKQETFELDDHTTVSLDLDRGVMPAGGKASVTLVATSDRPHKVEVALSALQNMGYGAERVENPPKEVASRVISLDAQPGGGPPVVQTFQLAKNERKPGTYEWFDILAAPAHRTRGAYLTGARVGIATWSGNSFALSIEPPVALPAEGGFSLAVRVKNTTKKPMREPDIRIGARIGGVDGLDSELIMDSGDYTIEPVRDESGGDEEGERTIAPGAEQLAIYKVTPRFGVDHFTFVAHASSYETGAAMTTLVVDRPGEEDAPVPGAVASR